MEGFVLDQFKKLIELRFHEAAGLLKLSDSRLCQDRYIPAPSPEKKNSILVVSERCVSIAKQCELLEIHNEIENINDHEDIMPAPRDLFYWINNADDGLTVLGLSTEAAVKKLKVEKRRPCATVEVLAIFREYHFDNPRKIKVTRFIDAAGSRYKENMIPTLMFDHNTPRQIKMRLMTYASVTGNFQNSGAASCSCE